MHFVACYEYLALAINIFRKLAVIVIYAINGEHISKSYYVWIVIYLAFAGIFALANKHKQESAKQLTNV
jgi:FtsH-binding integral membrane protein